MILVKETLKQTGTDKIKECANIHHDPQKKTGYNFRKGKRY